MLFFYVEKDKKLTWEYAFWDNKEAIVKLWNSIKHGADDLLSTAVRIILLRNKVVQEQRVEGVTLLAVVEFAQPFFPSGRVNIGDVWVVKECSVTEDLVCIITQCNRQNRFLSANHKSIKWVLF